MVSSISWHKPYWNGLLFIEWLLSILVLEVSGSWIFCQTKLWLSVPQPMPGLTEDSRTTDSCCKHVQRSRRVDELRLLVILILNAQIILQPSKDLNYDYIMLRRCWTLNVNMEYHLYYYDVKLHREYYTLNSHI